MRYLEITVLTTTAASEIAAEILTGEGSSGISIIDKNDFLELAKEKAAWDYVESGLIESMGDYARVSGYFDIGRKAAVIKSLNERFGQLKSGDYGIEAGPLEISSRVVDDNDWVDLWKKFFKPITIKGVTIIPEWLAGTAGADLKDGKRVILNPGMAFGTGEHETTAGCIELLQSVALTGKSVIDLGCGSGILGITAAVLGAEKVTMIDIDPLAVKASGINLKLNSGKGAISVNIDILEGNLFEKADLKADVIAANLSGSLLTSAAKEIAAHLNPGGVLILSGIIETRCREVAEAYERIFGEGAVSEVLHRGEWVALKIAASIN